MPFIDDPLTIIITSNRQTFFYFHQKWLFSLPQRKWYLNYFYANYKYSFWRRKSEIQIFGNVQQLQINTSFEILHSVWYLFAGTIANKTNLAFPSPYKDSYTINARLLLKNLPKLGKINFGLSFYWQSKLRIQHFPLFCLLSKHFLWWKKMFGTNPTTRSLPNVSFYWSQKCWTNVVANVGIKKRFDHSSPYFILRLITLTNVATVVWQCDKRLFLKFLTIQFSFV